MRYDFRQSKPPDRQEAYEQGMGLKNASLFRQTAEHFEKLSGVQYTG
jgi:hypothetical protein